MIKTVIFDFDGTLCDDFAEMMATFAEVARKENFSFDETNQEKLRNHGAKAFFFSLEGLEFWKIKPILEEVRRRMADKAGGLKLFKGIKLIEELKRKGIKIGIISSSPKEYVEEVLKMNGVNFVDFVIFEDNVFGKDKTIEDFVEKNKLNRDEAAYVGDENRDVDAANKAGVESIAVTWGYNNEDLLIASKPKKIAHTFEELIELFI